MHRAPQQAQGDRRHLIVEVDGYGSDGGRIVVDNFRADASPRFGVPDKIYCIAALGSDGVGRFNDWGYATKEEARDAIDAAGRRRASGRGRA